MNPVKAGYWWTEHYRYIYLAGLEGYWASAMDGHASAGAKPGWVEIAIRIPIEMREDELSVPGQVEGFVVVGEDIGRWGAWQFGDGRLSFDPSRKGEYLSLGVRIDALSAKLREELGGAMVNGDRLEVRRTLLESDRGVPAYIFAPWNLKLAPALNDWIKADPGLSSIVIPTEH